MFFQIITKNVRIGHDVLTMRLRHPNEYQFEPYIGNSLYSHLTNIKDEITKNASQWDRYKKYTNVYEYVHTIIPELKMSVCKYKPISRSFYKMIEILQCFHIIKDFEEHYGDIALRTFHLAEGPGGFIEALQYTRPLATDDKYIGMTLQSQCQNTPGWKKSSSALLKGGRFEIENGEDNSGDVTHTCNFDYCVKKYGGTIDLVTADGGFDFTGDFNNQELTAMRLILCETLTALALQKKGGYFVLKIYDIFMKTTIELIYLLCNLYEGVFMYKPHMSRVANSEKYIVCKVLLYDITPEWIERFRCCIQRMEDKPGYIVESILNIELDNMFVTKINDICSVIGQQQLENISTTLNLIQTRKSDKIDTYKKNNIIQCVSWCIKHNMPYNDVKKALPNTEN
jgi:23S rRNA U2552 (ribose-2'-O)-methylase RlmE/FtsJ